MLLMIDNRIKQCNSIICFFVLSRDKKDQILRNLKERYPKLFDLEGNCAIYSLLDNLSILLEDYAFHCDPRPDSVLIDNILSEIEAILLTTPNNVLYNFWDYYEKSSLITMINKLAAQCSLDSEEFGEADIILAFTPE